MLHGVRLQRKVMFHRHPFQKKSMAHRLSPMGLKLDEEEHDQERNEMQNLLIAQLQF
jgi:hypothetical protein